MSEITKRAMADALIEMMAKTPLSKITIIDITNKIGVSRMAFYYHFQDIYDLVDWICQEKVSDALKGKETFPWQFRMRAIFDYAIKDKAFVMNLYRSVNQHQIEQYIFHLLNNVIYTNVEQQSEGYKISCEDKQFITEFYQFGLIGVIMNWLKNDMKQSAEELTQAIEPLMKDHFKLAAHNYYVERKLQEL